MFFLSEQKYQKMPTISISVTSNEPFSYMGVAHASLGFACV
jgi:hypothetical protein